MASTKRQCPSRWQATGCSSSRARPLRSDASRGRSRSQASVPRHNPMDLFRGRALGGFARWRHTRRLLQLVLLTTAAVVVIHGLFGPQLASRNTATVFTWVHYRGLLVLALVAIGNLFCTSCPMILVRDAGRRLTHPALRWPRALRGKWIALALFAAVLFAYELFDLWELPRATAWLVLGYFATALVVDVLFAGASFCKYVCPVGQFNFAGSLMSPTELQV